MSVQEVFIKKNQMASLLAFINNLRDEIFKGISSITNI